MNNLFQNEFSEDDKHPPREQLLLYVDRELTAKEAEQVQAHLGACWWCRAKVAMIEETIAEIIRFDDTVLTPHLTPPPHGWRGFSGQLNRLATEMGGRSLLSHVRGWLGSLLPSAQQFSLSLQVAGKLAAAFLVAVIITALIIQSSRVPVVSASELLQRAATAQAQQAQSVAQPVVYQKLRIRRKAVASSRSSESTATLEIWNDLTNSRFKQSVDDWSGVSHGDSKRQRAVPDQRAAPAILVEIENALRANHFDSSRLLSAEGYQAWRDSAGPKDEKVEKTKLTDGSEALSLTTVVRGMVSSGAIAEAGLVVRARDWHPVAQRLRLKAENGDREYELTEIDFQVVGLDVVGNSIFADQVVASLPPATPSASPRPSPSAAVAAPPIPVPVDLEAAEIEVRVTLERMGADLGEPIEIVRQSERAVVVRGLVNTSERKAELIAALRGLPNVKASIRTVEEASREAQPGATQSTQSQPAEKPTTETASSKLPAQELLERHFSRRLADPNELRDAVEQFSKQALAHSENALAEAWALRRLAERYPPAEVKSLKDSSRRKLETIVRHHLASLRLHITRASTLAKPVLSAIGNEPSGAIAADSGWEGWPEFSAPLIRTVQQLDRLTTALFTVSSQARVSPSGAARELLGAFDLLESQLPHLEKWVAGEFLGNPESLSPRQP